MRKDIWYPKVNGSYTVRIFAEIEKVKYHFLNENHKVVIFECKEKCIICDFLKKQNNPLDVKVSKIHYFSTIQVLETPDKSDPCLNRNFIFKMPLSFKKQLPNNELVVVNFDFHKSRDYPMPIYDIRNLSSSMILSYGTISQHHEDLKGYINSCLLKYKNIEDFQYVLPEFYQSLVTCFPAPIKKPIMVKFINI